MKLMNMQDYKTYDCIDFIMIFCLFITTPNSLIANNLLIVMFLRNVQIF